MSNTTLFSFKCYSNKRCYLLVLVDSVDEFLVGLLRVQLRDGYLLLHVVQIPTKTLDLCI